MSNELCTFTYTSQEGTCWYDYNGNLVACSVYLGKKTTFTEIVMVNIKYCQEQIELDSKTVTP